MKTLPEQPTAEMLAALPKAFSPAFSALWPKICQEVYKAMYDAAPDTSAEAVAWTVNKDAERPKTVRGDWQDTKATLCAAIPGYMDLPATERQILWDLTEVIVKIHPTMTFKCSGCGNTFSRVHQYKCSDCDGAYCKSCIVPHFERTGTEGKPYKHIPHPSPSPDGLEADKVEALARYLCDEWEDVDRCDGYHWPEHANDDGYRGNGGWVKLQPPDVLARLRENAGRILRFLSSKSWLGVG